MKDKDLNLPRKIMYELAEQACIYRSLGIKSHLKKPGEFYQQLGPVKRSILENLKSDDISNVRWRW